MRALRNAWLLPFLAAFWCAIGLASFASAQTTPLDAVSGSAASSGSSGGGKDGGETASSPAPAGVDAWVVERLVATLEDEQRRTRLIEDLKALLATLPPAAPGEKDQAASAGEESGPGLNAQLATIADEQADRIYGVIGQVGEALVALTELPDWFRQQVELDVRRAFWMDVALTGIGLPILVALLARWGVGLLLRGSVRRLRDSNPRTIRGRVVTAVGRSVLEAASVAAVLAAGYAVLALVERSLASRQVAEFVIQAIAVQTGIGVIARFLLAPNADALRPLPLKAETAAYAYVWTKRLALVGTIGFVLSGIALPLGASVGGAQAVEIVAAIVFAGMMIVLTMQTRDPIATVIRGPLGGPVRRRVADIWHVLAIFYILMGFGIFVSGEHDGFQYLIRATAITVAAVAVGVIISRLFERLLQRLFDLDPELEARFPGLRARSNLYRPVLKRVVDALLAVSVAFAVLSGWDVGLVDVLPPEVRAAVLKSIGTIALVLVLCVLAWEFTSSAIARLLTTKDEDGEVREPSSRAKTLLPLLRRAIMIALLIFGGLIVLSEIGVNIGPLLAGAGVLGLAIGFGSQALVRDIITGLFILIEDTIAVGDVVTVGGHTGIVEDLSIRTIRLRDVEGTVHTVPFGDVTTVENLTKDFSFALLDIGVAYREDTDEVSKVLEEVGADMQADENWSHRILEPIQIMGVDQLADSAVVIRARIKTRPIQQWNVRREFFRRMKKRFDELNIEIPFPHTTVYFGVDRDGGAPAARIRMEAGQARNTVSPGAGSGGEDAEP